MRLALLSVIVAVLLPSSSPAQAPVFAISQEGSWIKFHVKASVAVAGKFDKWDATLTFDSPDETTGVLYVKIQADSVDTGSGMKNGKLKGKDELTLPNRSTILFDYAEHPNDIKGFQGQSFMDIAVDEATHLTEDELVFLKTCNRWPARPQVQDHSHLQPRKRRARLRQASVHQPRVP
jgi:hypothetical protein